MPASTPISRSKTAALTRVLDAAGRGYTRYVTGKVDAKKVERVIKKLHERHAIGATPAQRLTRKQHGQANAILALYWPKEEVEADWALLFTPGELSASEKLEDVASKKRLVFLGYELVRHAARGRAAWTWRRPKAEMKEHYAMLGDARHRRRPDELAAHLQRLANQPGFHGVREQSKTLLEYARRHGYAGELPALYYLRKVAHGECFAL
ncbi:hypothetical protein [Comamonas flocculans]|uniref:Uncharacterized protein n=1 Tax=Comamonas flocculans TaxID=2597701 RepID=A0A5B8RY86_9BURK|nr:hypothetical protein [Comamonas flocculans]QEA13552.1 hypothetical protein FOZ74_11200 [Comamonas flocculans]